MLFSQLLLFAVWQYATYLAGVTSKRTWTAEVGQSDWMDPAVWRACNPALSDFLSLKSVQAAANSAKSSPSEAIGAVTDNLQDVPQLSFKQLAAICLGHYC